MLENTNYYCRNDKDVDLFMSLLEKYDYKWHSGTELRNIYQHAPIVYCVNKYNCRITCCFPPGRYEIDNSIHVSNMQNKIIAELRR